MYGIFSGRKTIPNLKVRIIDGTGRLHGWAIHMWTTSAILTLSASTFPLADHHFQGGGINLSS